MNTENLKKEIKKITEVLETEGRYYLVKEIRENWDKTCLEYSKKLNTNSPAARMDPLMKTALNKELKRLNYEQKEVSEIIENLENNRVLQTSPHLSPTQKPRFFFINWLTSLSLNQNEYYPVAMFSGVPFSNKTRPGRLCSKEQDINLMPSTEQDALAYRSQIPEKMAELLKNTNLKINPKNNSYTKWALNTAKKIESEILKRNMIFFDFNEVVTNYILLALENEKHPISKILTGEEKADLEKYFNNEVVFYGKTKKGKYSTVENFYIKEGRLKSSKREIKLEKGDIKKELESGNICPGLPVGFLSFAFLNHFKCFGSFAQVEYLPNYQEKFQNFKSLKPYKIDKVETSSLTTGGFPDDLDLHPFDLITSDNAFNPNKDMLFGEALIAIKEVLLKQNYSANLVRK